MHRRDLSVACQALDPAREERIDDYVPLVGGLDLRTRHEVLERLLRTCLAEVEASEYAGAIGGSSSGEDGAQRLLLRRAEASPVGVELRPKLAERLFICPIPLGSSGCAAGWNLLPESVRKKHRT